MTEPKTKQAVEEKQVEPTRFLVMTKNPDYAEKTCGIQFTEGRAIIEEAILPKRLGRTVEEVVALFRDMPGYTVTPLE